MKNREKFKQVFGRKIRWSTALSPQILALSSVEIEDVDCAEDWLNEEYRPRGKWIITHYDYIECSNCENTVPSSTCGEYNYCPHCGADMIGTEKESK